METVTGLQAQRVAQENGRDCREEMMNLTPDHLAVLKAIDRMNKGAGTPATALLIDLAKAHAIANAGAC